MQPPRTLVVVLVAALVLGGHTLTAFGQLHWAIAKRSDEEIRSRIPKLLERMDQTPGALQSPAVLLEKGHNFRLERNPPAEFATDQTFRFLTPKVCLNQVFLVRDPAALSDFVTQPYFAPSSHLVEVAAFHLRGDKLTRLKESSWEVEQSDGHVARGRVTFHYPELKKGDVVGYSLVTESNDPLLAASIAAADRVPVVYYSLRVLANGAVTYDIESLGFPKPLQVKSAETKNARPSAWQVSCTSLAGIANLPLQGPYGTDVPHFEVSPTSIYFQSESMGFAEWAPVSSWNLAMINLSPAQWKTDGLDERVATLTTGATTPEEKMTVIGEYVRDQIRLLEGDRYDPHGTRETTREILSAGEATDREKVLLTLAMLKAAGVEAQLSLARSHALGPVNERGSLLQFPEHVVRVLGPEPTVLVPQCPDCPLGTLPPAWDGAMLAVPDPDLEHVSSEFMKKYTEEAMRKGRFSPQELMRAIEAEKWYSLENVPASTPTP